MRHIILPALVALVLGATAVVAVQDRATAPTQSAFEELEQRMTDVEERVAILESPNGEVTPTTDASPTSEPNPTTDPSPTSEPNPTTDPGPTSEPNPTTDASPTNFPDSSTTGVPSGIRLTTRNSPMTIRTDGQVVNGLNINGCIDVMADNVIIKNTRINCKGDYAILVGDNATGLIVEDVEMDGQGTPLPAVSYHNYTLRRVDIHGFSDGPRVADNVVIEDSYIHDLPRIGDSHNDGIQSTDGRGIVIRGNTIINDNGQTSAILLKADFGRIDDVLIEGNLLAGGAYSIYGGAWPPAGSGGHGDATNVRVIDNHFSTRVHPDGGQYGPAAHNGNVKVWQGNVWHETGKPIER